MSGASSFVQGVDTSFYVVLGISLLFLIGLTVAMIYFVIKYSRKNNPVAQNVKEDFRVEVLWIVVPTILVLIMFYFGWIGYAPMRDFPDKGVNIKVTARMWSWQFEYENGKWDSILVVPINEPVILSLYSPDVIHSLYIPAFRIKEDVTPGLNNRMWFKPTLEGEFDLLCAEYCGLNHSYMITKVVVLSKEEFAKWLISEKEIDKSVPPGLAVMRKNACISCHSTDGSTVIGPTFKNLYGSTRKVEINGKATEVVADDAYIKRSILDPNTEVSVGFKSGMMVSYKDKISDEELNQIIEYLKSLKE